MNEILSITRSSIGRKQIVAATGLLLILFVLGHLAGNLLIFLGPDAFNAYAKKMESLRPGLYVVEVGLAGIFLIHIYFTATLVLENIKARGNKKYAVAKSSQERSLATRLMPYSGVFLLLFIIWHLLDFTFINKHGDLSILADGKSYGLYGVVYNAFSDPIHSGLYVLAMMSLGLHLNHGVQSFAQTYGFNSPKYSPIIRKFSNAFAFFIAAAFSSIPVYILILSSTRY